MSDNDFSKDLGKFRGIAKTFGIDVDALGAKITNAFNDAIQPITLFTIEKDGKWVEVDYDVADALIDVIDKGTGQLIEKRHGYVVISKRQVIKIEWQGKRFYVPLLDLPKTVEEAFDRLEPLKRD